MENQPHPTQSNIEDYQEIDIVGLIRSLRRHMFIMFVVFSLTVITVTVKIIMVTPIYRSSVTLFIDQESSNVITISEDNMAMGQGNTAFKEYFQTQKEMILSRAVIEPVFNEFKKKYPEKYRVNIIPSTPSWADKVEDFINTLLGKYKDDSSASEKKYPYQTDPVVRFLYNIKVSEIRGTRLLELSVENEDPELAAQIANKIAQIYVERNLAYISKSEILDLHKNEYLKLQAKLNEYTKVYKHKHPKLIRLKEKLQDVTNKIKQGRDKNLPGGKVTITISDLAGLKANNISVQDWAIPAFKPVGSNKRKNFLIGIVFGLFAAVGFALILEYFDNTVKSAEDIERLLDRPFLGYIPMIRKQKKKIDFWMYLKPKSFISEAYRTIRTSLLFSSTQDNPINSMLITSPGQQEGKSTTICNLAIAMAQNNKKVLLVDADMRKPRLHLVYKTDNKTGLSHFLSNQISFKEIIHKTKVENLSFVSCGPHPPNPSELLASSKMQEFLVIAQKEFDLILFDTPPIMMVTDALVLSKSVDGIVIVFDSGKTSKKIIPRLKKTLDMAKSRVVGVVINKIKPKSDEYGSFYKYSSKYYGE